MSETQHFWEKTFYSFDMNRKNLADYFPDYLKKFKAPCRDE